MSSSTPRARARAQTMAEITRIGRLHLAEHGAAALSLRAVARDLGVVSSAVYRYVRSRDELLTLLLVDGYNELGDAVDSALAEVPRDRWRARLVALGRAVRTWARAEPATYALLFGSPVPGYAAPAEQTTEPGVRVILQLVRLAEEAHLAGAIRLDGSTFEPSVALRADLARIRTEFGVTAPDALVVRTTFVWSALFGAVSFEVFGQYGPDTFLDPDALFAHHLDVLADTLGLPADD